MYKCVCYIMKLLITVYVFKVSFLTPCHSMFCYFILEGYILVNKCFRFSVKMRQFVTFYLSG